MTEFPFVMTKSVLIVDDHPLFRAMLVHLINAEPGMKVCCQADNIQDAMTLIETREPDLALIDLSLNGSSGLDLIKQLKAGGRLFPILVISMHDEMVYAERSLRAGAKGFVSKQEDPDVVIKAIRKVMDGQSYASERVTTAMLDKLSDTGKHPKYSIMDALSDREIEILQLIGRGLNARQIAEHLNLSSSTVDSHRARIKDKLGVKNAAELYKLAAQWMVEREL